VTRDVDSPAVAFEHRRKAVEELLGGHVSPQALNLALLLTKRGRFAILPSVGAEYDALVRKSRGIVAATVTTPERSPPGADGGADSRGAARREQGGAGTDTDPSLVGGLTVRIGDRLIDASVRGRLERLRGRLVQGTS